ncbi:MAG: DUF4365 domain-containing protein [Candidatus Paceibacterota bacterium]
MPEQSQSQKTGSLGHSIVETQVKKSNQWIARNLTEDFGIDLELEYSGPHVSGEFVKAQIKSHKKIQTNSDFISQSLSKSFLRYVYECRVPIILIIVSTDTSNSWFLWLQKWIIESKNVSEIYDESETKSLTVKINIQSDFISGLSSEIISIATWQNETQLYLAVKDLANLSLQLYDDKLSKLLFDYLGEIKPKDGSDSDYFNMLLERIIELGSGIWATTQGNKLSRLLFDFVRENGEKLNSNHIAKLIIRGSECSRTGINALGILYDNYPNHTASLKLPERFKNFEDPRLHFYCRIRERFLGVKSPNWLMDDKDLNVGNLKVDFSSINTSVLDKWANRGDSVIFDYVFIDE